MQELEPGETSSRDKKIIGVKEEEEEGTVESHGGTGSGSGGLGGGSGNHGQRFNNLSSLFMRARKFAMTFGKFIGPGFMVCLLDIHPQNTSLTFSRSLWRTSTPVTILRMLLRVLPTGLNSCSSS
jgi:hypothetical protein